jgi:hypothetical protein
MSNFEVFLDESNDVRFGVAVEGSEQSTYDCRMTLKASDTMSLTFPGTRLSSGEVQVVIPSLKPILKEGTYPVSFEVIIDDRIFTPLAFNATVKQSMKVTAEARVVSSTSQPAVSVSILKEEPEEVLKPKVEMKPIPSPSPKPSRTASRKNKRAGSKGVAKIKKKIKENKHQPEETISDSEFRNLIRGFIKD